MQLGLYLGITSMVPDGSMIGILGQLKWKTLEEKNITDLLVYCYTHGGFTRSYEE